MNYQSELLNISPATESEKLYTMKPIQIPNNQQELK